MRSTFTLAAWATLLAACQSPSEPSRDMGGPVKCNYMGTLYDDGAEFPAADGCNQCKCNPTGNTPGGVGCSVKACSADAGPEVAATAPDGQVQCNYMGTLYDDGAEFPAADGCNQCKCNPTGNTPGGVGCTVKACSDAGGADGTAPPPEGPIQCNYMGTLYDDGAEFPAADGCNQCKCNPTGNRPGGVGCSVKRCSDAGLEVTPLQPDAS